MISIVDRYAQSSQPRIRGGLCRHIGVMNIPAFAGVNAPARPGTVLC